MNRLRIVLGACGIHLCIGSVYAWSVLTNPIKELTNWQLSEITFTFSIAILFLGLSAGFLGNKVQKWGPHDSAMISCSCFVFGLLGASYAIQYQSLPLLYLTYGCLGGIGLGVGYIAPVATLLKWFPNAKGFAGGCAVMSFGFSATIAGPYMQYLIKLYGVTNTLEIMAVIYGIIMVTSSRLLDVHKKVKEKYIAKIPDETVEGSTAHEAVRSINFWLLWIVFFINISCGIAVLSIAAPMGERLGMTAAEAAGMVGIIGLINGGGRIFFASISDYIGRGITYITFFVVETIAFFLLSVTSNPFLFQSIVLVIVSCYGGGFSCMPAYLADIFGLKYLSAIHGRILTAWGFAGLFGPLVITKFYEMFGDHVAALCFFGGLFIVNTSLAIILYIRYRNHEF